MTIILFVVHVNYWSSRAAPSALCSIIDQFIRNIGKVYFGKK